MNKFSIAIDIGAGLCVKLGLFTDPHHQIDDGLLRGEEFENTFNDFAECLLARLDQLLAKNGLRMGDAKAIGIASPGLFRSDGSYRLAANLRFL